MGRALHLLPCVSNMIYYLEYMVCSKRIVDLFGYNAEPGGRVV